VAIELPAGLVGDEADPNESVLTAAARELLEETGYAAGTMEVATAGPTSSGMTSEIISLVVATDLRKEGEGGGIANERIAVHAIPLTEIDAWLAVRAADGARVDPKVYAGLYFLRLSRGDFRVGGPDAEPRP
jgi:ADP-ribose pyrophosphatase